MPWAAILRHRFMTEKSLRAALIHLGDERGLFGGLEGFSLVCVVFILVVYLLFLCGDWMDVSGLVGVLSLFVVCGFYGASLDEGIALGE